MDTITKEDLVYALEALQNNEKKLNKKALTEKEIKTFENELKNNPVALTDFLDFYSDSLAEKREKTQLYLKTLLGKDFDVDLFVIDPRINIIRCYGKIIGADINILSKYNDIIRTDSKHYSIRGLGSKLQIKLIADEKDKIKDKADIIFSIINTKGCIF